MKPWKAQALRVSGELVVIVVGVLIALSADAWRESLLERRSEARHLRALREDVQESLQLLEESNAGFGALQSSLVRLLDEDLSDAAPDSVSQWVFTGLYQLYLYEPRLTAIRDLETSNQLQILQPAVRAGIAELTRRVAELDGAQADFATSQSGLFDPFLVTATPLASLLNLSADYPVSMSMPHDVDWGPLRTAEAENLIALKLSLARRGTRVRSSVHEQLDSLLSIVEERLEVIS